MAELTAERLAAIRATAEREECVASVVVVALLDDLEQKNAALKALRTSLHRGDLRSHR